jgi:hypothetical protein
MKKHYYVSYTSLTTGSWSPGDDDFYECEGEFNPWDFKKKMRNLGGIWADAHIVILCVIPYETK